MYQKLLLSEKIADNIMTGIKNGFYRIGDQMPNEVQLSAELGVSRATLREAFKILISKNILEVRRGIGTFVSDTPGFDIHAIGVQFLDLPTQKNEIIKLIKVLYEEEVAAFQHLPYVAQERIRQKLKTYEHSVFDIAKVLFEAIEEIAYQRQSTFKLRIMMIIHDALVKSMALENVDFDDTLESTYLKLCENIDRSIASSYFNEFLMQLQHLTKEV